MNMFVGLCLFVSVYDRYHVFMSLIFWVWEIGTNGLFFFLIKLPMCFCEEEKKEKRMKKKKNGHWSESVNKKERKKKKEEEHVKSKKVVELSESVKKKGEKIK